MLFVHISVIRVRYQQFQIYDIFFVKQFLTYTFGKNWVRTRKTI